MESFAPRITPAHLLLVALTGVAALGGCKRTASTAGPAGFAVQAVVVEAKRQPILEELSLVGSLAASDMIEVKAETEGVVEKILFKEGQAVKEGELLVKLDESKFAAAVAEAEANSKLTKATFERSKQLFDEKLISQQEFDQSVAQFQANEAALDLKRRQWKDTHICAPFDGIISARQISPGQVINRNTVLTWLVKLDPINVELNVPERFLSQVRVGLNLALSVAAYPGRTFNGRVYFVAPFVDQATRTALVKAIIPNAQHELKPGMFANLRLALKVKEEAVLIPESAELSSGDRSLVYVLDAAETAQVRPVKLGARQAGLVEVLSGLEAGERIIAEGLQKVRPGGKVKAVPPPAPPAAEKPAQPGEKTRKQESGESDPSQAARVN